MASEETPILFWNVAQVHPWWQDGNAEQAYNAQIFQQNTKGNS